MSRLSRRALTLQESAIRKLDAAVSTQTGVRFLRLNIGQPDVPTPPALVQALADFRPTVFAYGPSSGTAACRLAAANYFTRWSPGLRPEHVAITVGGSEALSFALAVLCDEGDEVLVPEPFYTNYNGFAGLAGAVVHPVTTTLADGFALPSNDVLDRHVTERTRVLLFSNPGNPTGAVYGRADLQRVVDWARARGLWVVADEVYRRIYFADPPESVMSLDGDLDHVVVVDSLSKTWSACGVRLGFLISRHAAFMERVERLGQARLGPQPLAQHLAIAALQMPESYYEHLRTLYRDRVTGLHDAVASIPGVKTHRPEGAFYLMAQLPVPDADAFARWLVTTFRHNGESVVVAPGNGFYADPSRGVSEVRLAAVLGRDELVRAAHILGEGLKAYTA